MATITKSIGTSSRDYSTITAWEADLDNTGIYTSGDDAVGECYNDAAFDEDVTINGGNTVNLNSVTLTVADGQRHDGTEGTGARLVYSGSSTGNILNIGLIYNTRLFQLLWLEVDNNGNANPYIAIVQAGNSLIVKNAIVHGMNKNTSGTTAGIVAYGGFSGEGVFNSIVYDCNKIGNTSSGEAVGISFGGNALNHQSFNNTVYGITSTYNAYGIRVSNDNSSSKITKNNIAVGTSSSSSNTADDFYPSAPTTSIMQYNLSSDSTASGTGSLTNKTAANQFVSTVAGSEDLHLLSTADAVGAGVDLATTSIDINGSDRNALAATIWDIGAHQYASTASIGTSSRDYSTIALWEADLDDTTIYGAGANAVGECYNDSDFTASININGGGTVGLSSRTLTVHPSHRHDGTIGTGAHVTYSSTGGSTAFKLEIDNTLVEWFSVKLIGLGNYGNASIVSHGHNKYYTTSRYIVGEGDTTERINSPTNGINVYGYYTKSHNNIIYNYMMANATCAGIFDHYGSSHEVYNNTVYNCPYGYSWTMSGNTTMKNNLVVGSYYVDFIKGSNVGTVVSSNNLSSDSTATINGGSNHVTGAPVSRQFVSTLSGSEDLHLIFKSAAIDAGVDLGTTPDGVQYDINGKDRDTENSIWDIGAHEYGDNVIFGLLRV